MFISPTRSLLWVITCLAVAACDQTPAPEHSLEVAAQGLHAAALDRSGEFAVVGSIYHGASLWRLSDDERLFNWNHQEGNYSTIIAADFDHSGRWVLTAENNTMVLWKRQSGDAERFWTAPGEILGLALGPDARFALLGLDTHEALVFDVLRGGIKHSLEHQNRVRSVDVSADGRIAVTGSEDFSARTWNVASGEMLQEVKHEDDVQLVRISEDGQWVLSMSKYDKALIWHSQNGEILGELPLAAERLKRGLRFTSARFNDDNTLLLTGRPDEWVQLWSLDGMQNIASWQVPKRDKWKPTGASILDVAFGSSADEFIVVASNGFVHRFKRPTANAN